MTDFDTACSWFCEFGTTFLSPQVQQMINYIDADLGLSAWAEQPSWPFLKTPANIDEAIIEYKAHICKEKTTEPEQYPEALVRLARYYYHKGKSSVKALETEELETDQRLLRELPGVLEPLEKSVDVLGTAVEEYRGFSSGLPGALNPYNPDLLKAVVFWLIGQVYLLMSDTKLAYASCKIAIDEFGRIAKNSGRSYLPEHGVFCGKKLLEMRKEIFCLPEKAYSWLDEKSLPWSRNYGGGNHMNEPTLEMMEILIQRQEDEKFREVYADLEKFLKISKESVHGLDHKMVYGEADALVVSGMLLFWMGNVDGAREKINKAADIYLPDTHSKAVSYWILA